MYGGRLARASAALLVGAALLPLDVAPARAVNRMVFYREDAVRWAAANWNANPGNPYQRFKGTDCANFVSQAWYFGGGVPMTDGWYIRHSSAWWRGNRDFSGSWVRAWDFTYRWTNTESGPWTATIRETDESNKYNPALKGDAILYDWGRGEGFSHLSLEGGWNSTGDKIYQHTSDRNFTDWNLGWRSERDPSVRNRMRFVVVHVNGYDNRA